MSSQYCVGFLSELTFLKLVPQLSVGHWVLTKVERGRVETAFKEPVQSAS